LEPPIQEADRALESGSVDPLVKMVLLPGNAPGFGKWLDLMMLLVAGRERTEEEYRRLFEAAGLELKHVLPTTAEVSILEGARA
jgi:hypothetical protein